MLGSLYSAILGNAADPEEKLVTSQTDDDETAQQSEPTFGQLQPAAEPESTDAPEDELPKVDMFEAAKSDETDERDDLTRMRDMLSEPADQSSGDKFLKKNKSAIVNIYRSKKASASVLMTDARQSGVQMSKGMSFAAFDAPRPEPEEANENAEKEIAVALQTLEQAQECLKNQRQQELEQFFGRPKFAPAKGIKHKKE